MKEKKNKKTHFSKALAILFSVALMTAAVVGLTTTAFAEEVTVSSYEELVTAVNAASIDGTETVIKVSGDITLDAGIIIPTEANVHITSADPENPVTITRGSHNGYMFNVNSETETRLKTTDITIDGGSISDNSNANAALLYANNSGAKITIGAGTVLQNNYCKNGGGVLITNKSNLILDGGIISGNKAKNGGGIAAQTESTITIYSGDITGNTSENSGGGIFANGGSTIVMHEGSIANNLNKGGTSGGGGVYINAASFTMNGGKITGNTAETSKGSGGGVYVSGNTCVFTMKGGEITGNTAAELGGGFHLELGEVKLNGGIIANNYEKREDGTSTHAEWGNAASGTITIGGDVTIPENEFLYINSNFAGATCVVSDSGILNINGTVTGNITNEGIVYLIDKGIVEGDITENTTILRYTVKYNKDSEYQNDDELTVTAYVPENAESLAVKNGTVDTNKYEGYTVDRIKINDSEVELDKIPTEVKGGAVIELYYIEAPSTPEDPGNSDSSEPSNDPSINNPDSTSDDSSLDNPSDSTDDTSSIDEEETDVDASAKTGDDFNIWMFVVIAIAAAIIASTVVFTRRQKQR